MIRRQEINSYIKAPTILLNEQKRKKSPQFRQLFLSLQFQTRDIFAGENTITVDETWRVKCEEVESAGVNTGIQEEPAAFILILRL